LIKNPGASAECWFSKARFIKRVASRRHSPARQSFVNREADVVENPNGFVSPRSTRKGDCTHEREFNMRQRRQRTARYSVSGRDGTDTRQRTTQVLTHEDAEQTDVPEGRLCTQAADAGARRFER
jgi:hypothetical protein